MNDIGISSKLDAARIEHLFKIGIFAALMVLVGDMLLGWGVSEAGTKGLEANFSRYMTVPDVRISGWQRWDLLAYRLNASAISGCTALWRNARPSTLTPTVRGYSGC